MGHTRATCALVTIIMILGMIGATRHLAVMVMPGHGHCGVRDVIEQRKSKDMCGVEQNRPGKQNGA